MLDVGGVGELGAAPRHALFTKHVLISRKV